MEASLEAGKGDQLAGCFDDDGRLRRTGTVWTASAHIIAAVIGSGVLSLAWAIAQLGWAAGPAAVLLFAFVTYYTSTLLADCYRTGDPVTGKRNYTYMDAVCSNLDGAKVTFSTVIQYVNLISVAIGNTIACSRSMQAVTRAGCFNSKGHANPCESSSRTYLIIFGATQILFSQIPDFDQIWWLSIVGALMSFTYSFIPLSLGIAQTILNGRIKGCLTGVGISPAVSPMQKIWRTMQAFGDIAFAYSFSNILIEIQDTIRAPPPSEAKVMNKATSLSLATTTMLYLLCGCMGYAAFGNDTPRNLLTGFGFYEPFWLLDIANVAIVIHHLRGYQVSCRPIFALVERRATSAWPNSAFIAKELQVGAFRLSLFRLTWRSAFVCLTTVVAMLLPFVDSLVGLLGAVSFWPLTVYFPVEMYIKQRKVERGSTRWVCLQMLSSGCLLISITAAAGSIADILAAHKV